MCQNLKGKRSIFLPNNNNKKKNTNGSRRRVLILLLSLSFLFGKEQISYEKKIEGQCVDGGFFRAIELDQKLGSGVTSSLIRQLEFPIAL